MILFPGRSLSFMIVPFIRFDNSPETCVTVSLGKKSEKKKYIAKETSHEVGKEFKKNGPITVNICLG